MKEQGFQVKPVRGLAAVLCVLALAGACAVALHMIPVNTGMQAEAEKKDEIQFLYAASEAEFSFDSGAPDQSFSSIFGGNSNAAQGNTDQNGQTDDTWSQSPFFLGSPIVFLIGKDGAVKSVNDGSFYILEDNRMFIRWADGYGTMAYTSFPTMTQHFRVETYDRNHLDGGATPSGTLGRPFAVSDDAAEVDLEPQKDHDGVMRIYKLFAGTGEEEYLVEISSPTRSQEGSISYYPGEGQPALKDNAALAARGMLGAAIPALLVLYWLLLPFWVYLDACRRNIRPDNWTALTIATNAAGFAVYLLVQRHSDRKAATACPACGEKTPGSFLHCPWCGAPVRRPCPECGRLLEGGWALCPWCGKTETAAEGQEAPAAEAPEAPTAPAAPATITLPVAHAAEPSQGDEDEGNVGFPFMRM